MNSVYEMGQLAETFGIAAAGIKNGLDASLSGGNNANINKTMSEAGYSGDY